MNHHADGAAGGSDALPIPAIGGPIVQPDILQQWLREQ